MAKIDNIQLEGLRTVFRYEVDPQEMNAEQKRIYNAFAFKRSKPYKFEVVDKYGNTIRFVLYTNKNDDGVLHIFKKHYGGGDVTIYNGDVTASEIINFCDVIRYGNVKCDGKSITYSWKKGKQTLILIVGLKKTSTGTNVLKSFYSNRRAKKTSKTAGSSKNCGADFRSSKNDLAPR